MALFCIISRTVCLLYDFFASSSLILFPEVSFFFHISIFPCFSTDVMIQKLTTMAVNGVSVLCLEISKARESTQKVGKYLEDISEASVLNPKSAINFQLYINTLL